MAGLRIGPTTAFEASVSDLVRRHLNAKPFPIYRGVDLVAEQNGERIGIEIKNWDDTPSRADFERALGRLVEARKRYPFDRILLVTRAGVEVPAGIELPAWLTVLTEDALVARVTDERRGV